MNTKIILGLFAGATLLTFIYQFMKYQSFEEHLSLMARKINKNSNSLWEAQEQPNLQFGKEDLKRMFNLTIDTIPKQFDKQPKLKTKFTDLPKNFDSREKWTQCESIKEVRDQGSCGSCWAFGAASAMSDRICIHSNQQLQTRISTEDMIECCHICGFGCNGGLLYTTWLQWKEIGICTGGGFADDKWCKPYKIPPCNHHSEGPYEDCSKKVYDTPQCERKCTNQFYKKKYQEDLIKGAKIYEVNYRPEEIMKEIFENGPVEGAFMVYEDFLLYKRGIYQHKLGEVLGGHAIKIIGWGEEKGIEYWVVVNSWNESWGDKGTFKIIKGRNHCGIEGNIVSGIPF